MGVQTPFRSCRSVIQTQSIPRIWIPIVFLLTPSLCPGEASLTLRGCDLENRTV
jgi:hypothetical protein